MLVTPSLQQFENNSSIDGNLENIFYFNVVGGDLVVKNRLVIQNIVDNETAYDQEQTTYLLQHAVPTNTLKNGSTYKARVMTYNQQGETSEWSEWLIFTVYSNPVVEFTNLGDGNITSQNYIFTASYSQAESLKMRNYRFLLYDSNRNLISESDLQTNKEIQYEIGSLENATNYYVEFRVTSMSNASATTGLKAIHVEYITSEGGNVLEVVNNYEDATIDLKVKVRDSRFAIRSGEVSYLLNDYIDLYSGVIYTDESLGFELDSEKWTLQFKFGVREVGDGEILRITGSNSNYLTFERIGARVFIRHYVDGQLMLNSWVLIGETMSDDEITIVLQKDGLGFNKHCIINRDDRIPLWTNEEKDVLTNKNREILISRKEVSEE